MPLVKANRSGNATFMPKTKAAMPQSASVFGWNKGINLGGPTSNTGDDSYGVRNLQYGVSKNTTQGSPSTPSLEISQPNFWRFPWVVKPGQRTLTIRAKQTKTFSSTQRPSLTVKANRNVGLLADLVAYAPTDTDWVVIGPIIFTSTGTDLVWVEVHNNLAMSNASAYFDHIFAT